MRIAVAALVGLVAFGAVASADAAEMAAAGVDSGTVGKERAVADGEVMATGRPVLTSYSILTLQDYIAKGRDAISGSVAAGGDATIRGDDLGIDLAGSKRPLALTVGGNLDYTEGTVRYGSVVYGGKDLSDPEAAARAENGTIAQGDTPDFARLDRQVHEWSMDFSKRDATGGFEARDDVGLLYAKADGLNVFNITDEDLARITTLVLDGGGEDVRAIINVRGRGIDRLTLTTKGMTGANTLFNFYEDDAITLSGGLVQASILAADAAMTFDEASVGGQVVARSALLSGSSFGGQLFTLGSAVGTVPEPESWALMIAGFGLIGTMLRRRIRQDGGFLGIAPGR